MSRFIDADRLKEFIATHDYLLSDKWNSTDKGMFTIGIFQAINEQPTADVVEVVRCKDCKYFHDGIYNGEYWMECDEYKIALSSDNWFCADGKRREG